MDPPEANRRFPIHFLTAVVLVFLAATIYWLQFAFAWRSGAIYWGFPLQAYANNSIQSWSRWTGNLVVNSTISMIVGMAIECWMRRREGTRPQVKRRLFIQHHLRPQVHLITVVVLVLLLSSILGINMTKRNAVVDLPFGDPQNPYYIGQRGERTVRGWPFVYVQYSREAGSARQYFNYSNLTLNVVLGTFLVLLGTVALESWIQAKEKP